jgi:CHAD domain-containing protein
MNRPNPRVTTALLARRARALKRHLRGAVEGDGTGVHQARVASRRLREAVPVLTAGLKGSRVANARRKIRRLTRALGTVRELDVTVKLLDELAARDTLPRLALEHVRAHVVKERQAKQGLMLKRLAHVNVGKLERRLGSVGDALQKANPQEWRQTLAARLLKRSKALRSAIEEAGTMYAPERLHRVRIATKKLRYAMEIAADGRIKAAAGPVRTLKRTQDTLGRLHDLQILQSHVAAVQAASSRRTPTDAGLDVIARMLEDECRHLHARYVAAIRSVLAVVESTRAVVVPQLARGRLGTRRPLKMDLGARASRSPASAPAQAGSQRR